MKKYYVMLRPLASHLNIHLSTHRNKDDAFAECRRLNGLNNGISSRPLSNSFYAVVMDPNQQEVFPETIHPTIRQRIEKEVPANLQDAAARYMLGVINWQELMKVASTDECYMIFLIQYNMPLN